MKNASFLKASCAVLLAMMVLLGCALPAFAEAEHDPDALVWESEAETAGEVKATRTYLLQNAMDSVVTELYVYPSAGTDKGENLAGDGLEPGEPVRVTVTGYMLRTENETLYTIEYAVGKKLFGHRSLHVEDLLFDTPIYLVGVDGVTSATFVSFGNSNMPQA